MARMRPDIFVSATSADLGEARRVVTAALLDLNCHPVVQEHFGAGQGAIVQKEAKAIEECDAVIHLSGKLFGAAPSAAASRSFTQLEYDAAIRCGKPLYLFLATEKFYETPGHLPSEGFAEERPELQAFQTKHYQTIRSSDRLWFEFSSLTELRDKILQLREKDQQWAKLVRKERRHYLAISVVILVLLSLVLAGVYFLRRDVTIASRTQATEIKKQSDELERVRDDLREIKQRLSEPAQAGQSEEERYKQALELVARKNNLSPDTVLANIQQFVDQVSKDPHPSLEDKELRSVAQKFILRGFTAAQFADYIKGLSFDKWKPEFIVLHNTGTPNLAQWRNSAAQTRLRNLERYYVQDRGWNGGPHLFIDDKQIWVFNDLTQPGIHASQWNSMSLGIEMVGDYNDEEVDPDVMTNTIRAIGSLCQKLNIRPETLRLHKEQPGNHRDCPGRKLQKEEVIGRVVKELPMN